MGACQRHPLATATALSIAMTLLLLVRTDLRTTGTTLFADPGWDRHLYRTMADRTPLDFHLAPYCWRVLVPAIAWAVPFGQQWVFLAVSMAAVAAAGAAVFALVDARYDRARALAALFIFLGMGWGPKYVLSDFWLPDPVAFAAVPLAALFAHRRQPRAFALCLALAVLAKESALVAAPLYYTLNTRRPLDARLALQSFLAVLPAVVLLLALRLLVESRNGDDAYMASMPEIIRRFPDLYPPYDYRDLARHIGYEQRWHYFGWDAAASYTWRPFGLAPFVFALAGAVANWRLALRLFPTLLLVYLQLVVATDTERLLVLAFPAIALLAAEAIGHLSRAARVPPAAFVPLFALQTALLVWDPSQYVPSLSAQAVVLAAGLAIPLLIAWRFRGTWRPAPA
ncbi:MAG: hypothetical protein IT302_08315 [Dehalococcoidia bacterium]|nr:hypothetical protein [Dehalococcoidia bacterium]